MEIRSHSIAAVLVGLAAGSAATQELAPDTTRVIPMEAVVVTAERAESRLAATAAAVSRLTASHLARFPQTTVADALRQVPGIALVDFGGDGYAPQLMVRGFYGGGEAEYVVVLLDGKPINDVAGGLVRWDAIPVAAIETIEVVRGGTSALWGDAAIGAVINIILRDPAGRSPARWAVAGGSFGTFRGSGHGRSTLFGRGVGVFGGYDRTAGFREHAERSSARAGFDYAMLSTPRGSVSISALTHWRDFQEPGPLLEQTMQANRRESDVFYRFDRTNENSQRLALDGDRWFGAGNRLTTSLSAERRGTGQVRTVALAPTFADTKERGLTMNSTYGTLQFTFDEGVLPWNDRLVIGGDGWLGNLASEYYRIVAGPRPVYTNATGARGDLDTSGNGTRAAGALFAQYALEPTEAVRLSLGLRGDWLRDRFRPDRPEGGARLTASHGAVSPKAGINVRWLQTATQTGNVYATAGQSFKAPTLDQLFDQRTFPVPFPPFEVATANPLLEPQRGVSLEAGLYHQAGIVADAWLADLALSAYQMDMENELDFDLQTLRYINLGESRHRGLETALGLNGPAASRIFLNYTIQDATERSGVYAGSYLRAIPRQLLVAGAGVRPLGGLHTGLEVSHTRGIYLDDANSVELPAFTRVDARLSYPIALATTGADVFLDLRNLLGAQYSTTGFPDPSGTGAIYYYPAAGRTVEIGLRRGL